MLHSTKEIESLLHGVRIISVCIYIEHENVDLNTLFGMNNVDRYDASK